MLHPARRLGAALIVTWALAAPASASAQPAPAISSSSPCMVGSCRATLTYTPDPGQAAQIEVEWEHSGAPAESFQADATVRCAGAGLLDTIFGTLPVACTATSPPYGTPGATQVVVRVTLNGGAPTVSSQALNVVDEVRPSKPTPDVEPDPCGPRRAGEQCGPGNSRKTSGGGAKVSHKGWPAITGILWKVLDSGRHRRTGGRGNDELLGHHGNEVIRGGAGKDIIWGDWDPSNNGTRQVDRLFGDAGNDWIYSSHGRNTIRGGAGKDYVWAFYGRGSIDCGPGFDTLRIKLSNQYSVHNCERIKNFCSFGSKPGNRSGCYKPGEKPKRKDRR